LVRAVAADAETGNRPRLENKRRGRDSNFLMFFQCFLEVRNVLRAKFSSKYEEVLDGGVLDAVNGQDGIET
jgi:hypothetical protein